MASFSSTGNSLAVRGDIIPEEVDDFVTQGSKLLSIDTPRVLLDMREAQTQASTIVGAIAQLGAEARANEKALIVRADGKLADLLVWAGLHRVVTLYVSGKEQMFT